MKRALVTGAGHRLGRAMAVYLARQGYDVAVHYASSSDEAEETGRLIEAAGRNAEIIQADMLEDAQTVELFADARARLGGDITCLVNNASIFEYDNLETSTRTSWDRHFQSNLRAPFILTQEMAAQGLIAQEDAEGEPVASGVIVNMIDQRVRKLTPEFMTYTLAKSALWTLTRTSSQALAPAIRVNAIGPGPTLKGTRQTGDHFARQRGATVLKRGADPEDITAALGYLIDAKSVTGQLICVDGGQHLVWQTPDILGLE